MVTRSPAPALIPEMIGSCFKSFNYHITFWQYLDEVIHKRQILKKLSQHLILKAVGVSNLGIEEQRSTARPDPLGNCASKIQSTALPRI